MNSGVSWATDAPPALNASLVFDGSTLATACAPDGPSWEDWEGTDEALAVWVKTTSGSTMVLMSMDGAEGGFAEVRLEPQALQIEYDSCVSSFPIAPPPPPPPPDQLGNTPVPSCGSTVRMTAPCPLNDGYHNNEHGGKGRGAGE